MKKQPASLILFLFLLLLQTHTTAQSVGIGTSTPNASSALDISNAAKGLLIPRMTTTGISAIANPAKGLMVYDSLLNQLMVNMGSPGTPNWQTITANSGWSLTGNSGTDPSQQFLGTNDNQPLRFKVNGLLEGELNSSTNSVFLGQYAGANSTGTYNVGVGDYALYTNTLGVRNTGIGVFSLEINSTGNNNTAVGLSSLSNNKSGNNNVGVGYFTLSANNADNNTAVGAYALQYNANGYNNTAVGYGVLTANKGGNQNTALGYNALFTNVNGGANTAVGNNALILNINGNSNTAFGSNALYDNNGDLGSYNTGFGNSVLYNTSNSEYNTAIGYNAAAAYDLGYNNTILGANCGVNQSGLYNCIAIGQAVICDASSQARIGNAATNSIGGYADWTNFSDGRYKRNIKEDVKGLDFIMKLRPVTYNLDVTGIQQHLQRGVKNTVVNTSFKKEIAEKERTKWSGFVAQEVEQAAKESGYEFSGVDKPQNPDGFYGLRYSQFVVPLIKAVQELNEKVLRLEKENAQLKSVGKPDDALALISKQQILIEEMQQRLQQLETKNKLAENHPVTSN